MNIADAAGEPHSIKRYIVFGAIAGLAAGALSAWFDWNLPIVVAVAGIIAGWVAGIGGEREGSPA